VFLFQPIQVVPQVYQLQALWSRVTALFTAEGVVLVDAGGVGSLPLISAGLRELGASLQDVRLVVLTHYHGDHAGGLKELAEATGARVAVHCQEAEIIQGKLPLPNPFQNTLLARVSTPFLPLFHSPPVTVDYALQDGDVLPYAGEVQVVHSPGHTPGSISLYLPEKRIIIVGDALQYRFRQLSPPMALFTQDQSLARASLAKLLTYAFDTMCFSHFSPLRHTAHHALEALVQKLPGAE
jgi:glyoxylase-like metal-dependent hydrolase (beta-lactamase superfamily II)